MEPLYYNIVEQLLEETYEEHKDKFECCNCTICKCDTIAIALNQIEPKYVATKRGELMVKLVNIDQQYRFDILKHLLLAVELVNASPRH